MRFAPEGRPFIVAAGALAGTLWAVGLAIGTGWLTALAGVATLALAFVAYFFRDPDRQAPGDETLVLAPADGRVLSVEEVTEPTVFQGPCRRMSIFLSVFNVHVQRAPLGGTVTHRSYRPGGYAVAWKPKASEDNEQASLGLETKAGPVLVRQIAGLVARRIVTYPTEGDRVDRGERIGIIRFGSRVDLFIPLDWPVDCAVGDVVRGGATSVARVPAAARAAPSAAREPSPNAGAGTTSEARASTRATVPDEDSDARRKPAEDASTPRGGDA
jgi:phosphatidylserine decarboxylase